ncbi:MAG TPA: M10 family metallopeptidase C-terminal domain-containing protein [Allosphingosinicella sp.]|nr:M10 family metallopeptidase C-terminal domain-containing protein [Allosphingosinicella sp.]
MSKFLVAFGRAAPRVTDDFFSVRAARELSADLRGGDIFVVRIGPPPSTSGDAVTQAAGAPMPVDETWVFTLADKAPAPEGETWVLPLAQLQGGETWLLPRGGNGELVPTSLTEAPPLVVGLLQSAPGGPATILATDPLAGGSGAFVDMKTKTVLSGGIDAHSDVPGSGDDDVLVLGGDMNGSLSIGGAGNGYERIVLVAGSSYSLVAGDANVAAGHRLTIDAAGLGPRDAIAFDGTAELDGAFLFHGGAGDDAFRGGAGNDVLYGLGGADRLAGGAGADVFAYTAASESSGRSYDTLADFDFGADKIDLPVAVSGFAAAVAKGALSAASFDANLGAAMNGHLGAHQALLFTPDSGDLAGKAFLIVDANGQAGYQAGEDYVFLLGAPPPADLGNNSGIFV